MAQQRSRRDIRIDFFRGVALWWIFTDHVPRDVLGDVSLRNFTLCDATELFVFLAGYAAGLAYGAKLRDEGWFRAAASVVNRAWTLYVAHIFLFVVFSAQVAWSAKAMSRADYLDEIHLDVVGNHPYRAMLEALILHFQPAYLNILPLYIVILLLFAASLPLLERPRLYLAGSVSLYALIRLTGINLGSWTGGSWFFNPFAWQLLFVLGALISFHRFDLATRCRPVRLLLLDALSIAVLGLGLCVIRLWAHPAAQSWLWDSVADYVANVDKTGLHPLRLTAFLALAWLTSRLVHPDAAWFKTRLARPVLIAGQHSLPVFCFGIFAAFIGRVVMEFGASTLAQVAVNVLGAASMAAVAMIASWYKHQTKSARTIPSAPAPYLPASSGAHTPVVEL